MYSNPTMQHTLHLGAHLPHLLDDVTDTLHININAVQPHLSPSVGQRLFVSSNLALSLEPTRNINRVVGSTKNDQNNDFSPLLQDRRVGKGLPWAR